MYASFHILHIHIDNIVKNKIILIACKYVLKDDTYSHVGIQVLWIHSFACIHYKSITRTSLFTVIGRHMLIKLVFFFVDMISIGLLWWFQNKEDCKDILADQQCHWMSGMNIFLWIKQLIKYWKKRG